MTEKQRRPPLAERYYYTMYPAGPYTPAERADDAIRTEIKGQLVADNWVDATGVEVRVLDGVATLSGRVASIVEKRAAGDDAWDTPGVRDVQNNLEIAT